MRMDKEKLIKLGSIVIGLLITVLLIWFGLRFVQRGRADDSKPTDVVNSNITDRSFRTCYTAPSDLTPVLKYGQSSTSLSFLVPSSETTDMGNNKTKYCHDVDAVDGGTIYFVIVYGDVEYDSAGVPFSVQLIDASETPAVSVTPTGSAELPTATPDPALISPTLSATTPTPTFAGGVKPLSEVTDCSELKDANGLIKEGYTARDWAQCIKQNP